MKAAITGSLVKMGVDYIDIYQCHFVNTDEVYDEIMADDGAYKALTEARDQGLIGHIGISTHSLDICPRVIKSGKFETILVCFGLLEPKSREEVIPMALEHGMGVQAMKAFAGGVIEDGEVALKFVLGEPEVLVLAGMETPDLFDQNWGVYTSGSYDLSPEEQARIKALQKQHAKAFCRRCDYCQPCPEGINIQMVLGIHTQASRMGAKTMLAQGKVDLINKARGCVECGECEDRCPYELPIRELLKKQVAWYDGFVADLNKEMQE